MPKMFLCKKMLASANLRGYEKVYFLKLLMYLYLCTNVQVPSLILTSFRHDLVVKHWIPNSVVPISKPVGGSKEDSVFNTFEVNQMSTRSFLGTY